MPITAWTVAEVATGLAVGARYTDKKDFLNGDEEIGKVIFDFWKEKMGLDLQIHFHSLMKIDNKSKLRIAPKVLKCRTEVEIKMNKRLKNTKIYLSYLRINAVD